MSGIRCCFGNKKGSDDLEPLTNYEHGDSSDPSANVVPQLPDDCGNSISWSEIIDGTQNLNETKIIGQGNFGKVYRCEFPNIKKVGAVKVQKQENELGDLEFVAEVKTLHAADHPNVIKLLGRCYEPDHRAIVYEFMPYGSLDRHILAPLRPGPNQRPPLDWATRMKISLGVAQALAYVHKTLKMVHRDIKAGNVLLDKNYEPRVTDFGLAVDVVIGENGAESRNSIFPVKGTHGWLAPETQREGFVSTKSDVFSYGVFLLHIFTGKKPCDEDRSILIRNIADWFLQKACGTENYERMIVDASLGTMYSVEGLRKIFSIARMCIYTETHVRPTMNMVVTMIRDAASHQAHENSPVTERIL